MSSNVVNPTNAPPNPSGALPFTSQRHLSAVAKAKAKPDAFNTGGDYVDEGLPLMESEMGSVKARQKPAFRIAPGLVDFPTLADVAALTRMDESAQGNHINYVRNAIIVDVDAKIITSDAIEMRKGKFLEAHYPTLEAWMGSEYYRRLRESNLKMRNVVRLAEKSHFSQNKTGVILSPLVADRFRRMDASIVKRLKEAAARDLKPGEKKLREQDLFSLDDTATLAGAPNFDMSGSGRDTDFIPLLSGPYNKQLYWFDYLDMHSKAFEAWTHNPIAKRIVKTIAQFVLGKGVKATIINAELSTGRVEADPKTGEKFEYVADLREEAQVILDEHWAKNSLAIRSKQILRDLIIFGEQFVRYFEAPWGLKVRQIDPSTVWELVTDPDDAEMEFYLHQQYPTKYQWYVDLPIPTIKFIIRQVPAKLYHHMKINTVAGEVRGRSELFTILGWLKRLKEFASDRVIRNKMGNLFILDVSIEGGEAEVAAAKAQFAVPATPGSFFIHNKASELAGIRAEVGASDVTQDWDMLLTVLSMGSGVSKEYLGMAPTGSKAQALVGTEPDIKTFEDYQEIMEQFFLQDAERAFQRAKDMRKLPEGVVIKVEITYPALAEENRSEKLKDLAFMESMSWITHRRASTMSAKEMQVTTYEYDEEQEEIVREDAETQIKFNAAYKQALKGQTEQAGSPAGGGGQPGLPAAGGGGDQSQTPGASANESKKRWGLSDPRDVAESMLREAANVRLKKKPVNRRRNRWQTPSKVRDQKTLDRGEIVKKGRKALLGDYNESGAAGLMEPFKKTDGEKIQDPPVHATAGRPVTKLLRRKPTPKVKP